MTVNSVVFEEQKKYIERFYEPSFSAYDFVSLFSVLCATQNEYSFSRDNLIVFINFCKIHSKYDKLLGDINLKSNGIFYYSEEFDEAIAKLKWGKILYTVSPEQDSNVYIFENIPTEEIIKPRVNYLEEVSNFISEYKNFENNNSNKLTLVMKRTI